MTSSNYLNLEKTVFKMYLQYPYARKGISLCFGVGKKHYFSSPITVKIKVRSS